MSLRRWNAVLFCVTFTLGSGCASATQTEPTPEAERTLEAPTPQDLSATPAATAIARGQAGGAVITFARTGGIAGISELWSIYPDGRVLGVAGEEGRIPADEVSQLLAEIEAAGFFEWAPRPRSLQSCADCFTYSITVEFQGKINRVTLVDGESGAPEEAWAILERILEILEPVSK